MDKKLDEARRACIEILELAARSHCMEQTLREIAFEINRLVGEIMSRQYQNSPTEEQWEKLNRILKHNPYG